MGRPELAADGGPIYHVLNRANAGMAIFEKLEDYATFEQVLEEAIERTKTRLLAYGVLSTHWGGQRAACRGGVLGAGARRESRLSFRGLLLVGPDRTSIGAGKYASSPRTSRETQQRFLTHFLS
jgi:hypothetical protein